MAVAYYIIEVHYKDNDTSKYIDEVRTINPTDTKTRTTVVNDIEAGNSVMTAIKKSDGKYYEGEDVHVIMLSGSKYLRTDKNNTPKDNLENLPTYDK